MPFIFLWLIGPAFICCCSKFWASKSIPRIQQCINHQSDPERPISLIISMLCRKETVEVSAIAIDVARVVLT